MSIHDTAYGQGFSADYGSNAAEDSSTPALDSRSATVQSSFQVTPTGQYVGNEMYAGNRTFPTFNLFNGPQDAKMIKPCHICGELGHWLRECPRRGDGTYNVGNNYTGRNVRQNTVPNALTNQCFNCQQEGHMARNCMNQSVPRTNVQGKLVYGYAGSKGVVVDGPLIAAVPHKRIEKTTSSEPLNVNGDDVVNQAGWNAENRNRKNNRRDVPRIEAGSTTPYMYTVYPPNEEYNTRRRSRSRSPRHSRSHTAATTTKEKQSNRGHDEMADTPVHASEAHDVQQHVNCALPLLQNPYVQLAQPYYYQSYGYYTPSLNTYNVQQNAQPAYVESSTYSVPSDISPSSSFGNANNTDVDTGAHTYTANAYNDNTYAANAYNNMYPVHTYGNMGAMIPYGNVYAATNAYSNVAAQIGNASDVYDAYAATGQTSTTASPYGVVYDTSFPNGGYDTSRTGTTHATQLSSYTDFQTNSSNAMPQTSTYGGYNQQVPIAHAFAAASASAEAADEYTPQ